MPITPNNIKIILDKKSIVLEEILLPNNLPKKMAIESLATIPQIEPQIRGILKRGYSTPRPIEAKKVLSPSSPIAIVDATINIQLLNKEVINLTKEEFGLASNSEDEEPDFFAKLIKPIIPNKIKVKYVKIFK